MPATEKTARDTQLLHKLFGISGALLLFATFWMLSDDHSRTWKGYQREWIALENRNANWEENAMRGEVQAKSAELQQQLFDERRKLPEEQELQAFVADVDKEARAEVEAQYAELKSAVESLNAADEAAFAAAADSVVEQRRELVEVMNEVIAGAEFKENKLLRDRKFESAVLDKLKSDLGIAVRDNKPLETAEVKVAEQSALVADITLAYQEAAAHRKSLQKNLDRMLAEESEVQKELGLKELALSQLDASIDQRSSEYFTSTMPFLGKRWLELPILDAFNSPRKIDNLWTDNLMIDYNFREVRRFDRCTTCHQGIDKSGGYVPEHELAVTLLAPESGPVEEGVSLESIYGLVLGDVSLTGTPEVTVHAVKTHTPAAAAEVALSQEDAALLSTAEIKDSIANPYRGEQDQTPPPGLQMGDVILRIDGNDVSSVSQAQRLLTETVAWGEPIKLRVRRGVPHPFTAHPRLDLFLGSLSPHPISKFGCTSCHEGQGNATDFKWTSHTPNSLTDRTDWMKEHGWFNNHHWIYPMRPERFAESGCLKCHHDVTELTASARFPEAPAPKVTQGHQLILKYGCFGCHEINGYNGSERIGPDLRLEPNFFAAALALQGEANYGNLPADVKDLVDQVAEHPERDAARRQLIDWLSRDQKSETPQLSTNAKRLADVLKDVESPGQLRKVGPSLRYAASKLDEAFMYDWIENPRNFRPSTRMPRFFGLNAHLAGSEAMHTAEKLQPIEILAISTYLLDRSQQYDYVQVAEGITPSEQAEQIARGKELFEVRGCLACHNHDDFPTVANFRPAGEVPPGPDLSGIGSKFSNDNGGKGAQWLYSWIRNPSSYNPRTIMPDLKLDPIEHFAFVPPPAEGDAADPAAADPAAADQPAPPAAPAPQTPAEPESITDPIADIVAYLMASQKEDWQPQQALKLPLDAKQQAALEDLSIQFLNGAFYVDDSKLYYDRGISSTSTDVAGLKGAEVEMVVPADGQMSDRQRLLYVGRKAIGKYGCYACHDIPGFEDAKPIGATLADWGRKDPSRLAFEHISEYLAHGHGGGHDASHEAHPEAEAEHADEGHAAAGEKDYGYEHGGENFDPFFHHALEGHERDGFLYQKLREPRSYDYHSAEIKGYNDWLRMPQFPFGHQQREEVMTFILGLVADPPAPEFVYAPTQREKAVIEGKQVLAKYNCTGCHMLSVEQWEIAYQPGTFTPKSEDPTYPFVSQSFSDEQLASTSEQAASSAGFLRAHLTGLPAINNATAIPVIEVDDDGQLYAIEEGEEHNPEDLYYQFQLWDAVPVDGHAYQVANVLTLQGSMVTKRQAPEGGSLTRYLLPKVTALEKQANPNANGTESYGWLPPALVNQGNKTQGDWLFSFLLDPHQIRPAVYLQMPKFNMSPDESRKLVNYFAARDNANFPYEYQQTQRQDYLARMESAYSPEGEAGEADESETQRLDAAMQIVVNKNYCVTCHLVGEFSPGGSNRAKAPNLAEVYKRLRYDYVFPWIADPDRTLPYTAMPSIVPYKPSEPNLGGIPQSIYHGSSIEQVQALSDLLLNYDKYAKAKTQIDPLVQEARAAAPAEGEAAAPDAAAPTTPAPPPPANDPNAAAVPPAPVTVDDPNDNN